MAQDLITFGQFSAGQPLKKQHSTRVYDEEIWSVSFSSDDLTFPDTQLGDASVRILTITNAGTVSFEVFSAGTTGDFALLETNLS